MLESDVTCSSDRASQVWELLCLWGKLFMWGILLTPNESSVLVFFFYCYFLKHIMVLVKDLCPFSTAE